MNAAAIGREGELDAGTASAEDCEDYAIVKYVALTEAGIAAEDVKLEFTPPSWRFG
jgi:predicted transglutaminase-like cysteine proteinase